MIFLPIGGPGRESGLLTAGCRDLPAKSNDTPNLVSWCGETVCLSRPAGEEGGERTPVVFGLWQLSRYFSRGEQFEFVPIKVPVGKVDAISHHTLALLEQQ